MKLAHVAVSALFAALLTGCDDELLGSLEGSLLVPRTLDFGDVPVGAVKPRTLEVENPSPLAARVEVRIPETAFLGFGLNGPTEAITILPGATAQLTISFRPDQVMEAPREVEILVTTNFTDPDTGEPVVHPVRVLGRGVIGGLLVLPDPLSFGRLPPGSSRTLRAVLSNGTDVAVTPFIRLDPNGLPDVTASRGEGRFELIDPSPGPRGELLAANETLGPGQTVVITVRHHAADRGRSSNRARWTLAHCEAPACEVPLHLEGETVDDGLRCEPAELDLGAVRPGTSRTGQATCTNVSGARLELRSVALDASSDPAFTLTSTHSNVVLEAGESTGISVRLAPDESSAGRRFEGRILVDAFQPETQRNLLPAEITLIGRAGGARLEVRPARLDFGLVEVGGTSVLPLRLINLGDAPLEISELQLDRVGAFSQGAASAFAIPAGGEAVVTVTFAPPTNGAFVSLLQFRTELPEDPSREVYLTGEGVQLGPCQIEAHPAELQFGDINLHRQTTRPIRLLNVGPSDCLVRDPALDSTSSPDLRLVEGPRFALLAPGEAALYIVAFRPTDSSASTARLQVRVSNAAAPLATIPIRGDVALALLPSPDELDFGVAGLGCAPETETLRIFNPRSTPLTLERIANSATSTGAFEVLDVPAEISGANPTGQFVIPPLGRLTLRVRHHPRSTELVVGRVSIWEVGHALPLEIPLFGRAGIDPDNEEVFLQSESSQVDVLLVEDNSSSMKLEQAQLLRSFPRLIEYANAEALDYQIGIISTDMVGDAVSCITPVAQRPANAPQGACGYFADGGPNDSDPNWRIIRPNTQPSPRRAFGEVAALQLNGSATEAGLLAAYRALTPPLVNGWNAGFLSRHDSFVSVVFISDEEDQSPGSVELYAASLRAIRGQRMRRLFNLAGIVSEPEVCGLIGSLRYLDVIGAAGGYLESICTTDWDATVDRLAKATSGWRDRFVLAHRVFPPSLEVEVDGAPRPAISSDGKIRWELAPDLTTLIFRRDSVPPPGSEVVIRYRRVCL